MCSKIRKFLENLLSLNLTTLKLNYNLLIRNTILLNFNMKAPEVYFVSTLFYKNTLI